jgi:hypothetical protein
MFNKPFNCHGDSIKQALHEWLSSRNMTSYKALPAMVCWWIWIHRNKGIFKDMITTPQVVASNILAIASHFSSVQKSSWVREIRQETIDKSFSWGYFDGVAQGDPIYCDAGAILYLREDHFYLLKWGLGVGTNNKTKLLALYMLLIFADEKGLLRIQIFGDSMLVIN